VTQRPLTKRQKERHPRDKSTEPALP
jgi:hypothetical protein